MLKVCVCVLCSLYKFVQYSLNGTKIIALLRSLSYVGPTSGHYNEVVLLKRWPL